jgi:glyoxylase I family protein
MQTFTHVGMTCRDPLVTERFYSKHFGFQRARVVPLEAGKSVVFLKSGGVYLELFSADLERPTPAPGADGPHYPGLRHLAFRVDDVAAKLAAMGSDAKITLGPLHFDEVIRGWRSVWVADPDGNVVEITQGYSDDPALAPQDSAERNRAVIRRYIEEHWNAGNAAVADEVIAPDFINREPFPGQKPGPEGVKFVVTAFRTAFPDYHATIQEMVAAEDRVATYTTATGTHQGPFRGMAPTGKAVTLRFLDFFRLRDGQIVERQGLADSLGLLQQLGVIRS